MFFIIGVSSKQEDLDFRQVIECPSCRAYGSLQAFMVYSHLSLFFIPLFKWSKKYFIRSTCCNHVYNIDNELGRAIEKGENPTILPSDLQSLGMEYDRERK